MGRVEFHSQRLNDSLAVSVFPAFVGHKQKACAIDAPSDRSFKKYRTPERLIHLKSDVEIFSVALDLQHAWGTGGQRLQCGAELI